MKTSFLFIIGYKYDFHRFINIPPFSCVEISYKNITHRCYRMCSLLFIDIPPMKPNLSLFQD